MLIDTHCHIYELSDIKTCINNMKGNIMIVSSASPNEIDEVIKLCETYENVYGTIGIHPEYASTYTEEDINKIIHNIKNPKIVGIGEIGLDYHYTKENKEKQKELFIKQIHIANIYHKTIVVHSRDASEDTYNILAEEKNQYTLCDIHCFSGSLEMAKKFIKLNTVLGIGGVLTFKNEKKLKDIVKELPIENFVLETDSPYLAPEPFRGKENEPANTKYVALKIAELKGIKYTEVLEITSQNAIRQFDLPIKLWYNLLGFNFEIWGEICKSFCYK